MSNEAGSIKEKESSQTPSGLMAPAENGCHMHAHGWLKGGLTMAICCVAPLLLFAAVAFFGLSLGALASGALSLAALLACPAGMFLMMRMIIKDKQ